ncbi:MAG: FecR domain-containing protein [Candidatus Ozemobacteraceae bacterium]
MTQGRGIRIFALPLFNISAFAIPALAVLLLLLSTVPVCAQSLPVFREITPATWTGDCFISSATFRTGADGQMTLKAADGIEIRLKENTSLVISDGRTLHVERGLAGFRKPQTASSPADLVIDAPHMKIHFNGGLLVVKANPILTRSALLKGKAILSNSRGERRELGNRMEAAAGARELSEIYQATDQLYFAWYWDPPKR